jgi:hypothetical protein
MATLAKAVSIEFVLGRVKYVHRVVKRPEIFGVFSRGKLALFEVETNC